MAGSKSDAHENLYLNWLFRSQTFTQPGTVWIGLWTAALSDASTGSTAGEVSGSGYARAAIPCGTATWDAPSGGTTQNTAAISFGTAGANWGTVTHLALLNAASAGTIYYWSDLTASKIIQTNDPVQIAAGDLDITEA